MAKTGDAYAAAVERTERAKALVEAGAFLVTGDAVLVYSDRAGVPGYTVEAGRCSCPDATLGEAARLRIPCKHATAAELIWNERRLAARRRLEEIAKEFSCE